MLIIISLDEYTEIINMPLHNYFKVQNHQKPYAVCVTFYISYIKTKVFGSGVLET